MEEIKTCTCRCKCERVDVDCDYRLCTGCVIEAMTGDRVAHGPSNRSPILYDLVPTD